MNLNRVFRIFILLSGAFTLLIVWSTTLILEDLVHPTRVDSSYVKRHWEAMMNASGTSGAPVPVESYLPGSLGIPVKAFTIQRTSGYLLQCWYFDNTASANSVTVVILHDVGEGMANYLSHVQHFHDRGFRVCLVDQAAHGYSGGERFMPGTAGVADIRLLLDSIYSWPETVNCALLGVGTGALIAAHVVAADDRPHALILQSPVASIDTLVDFEFAIKWGGAYRWLLPVVKRNTLSRMSINDSSFNLAGTVSGLEIPIMFLTGTGDRLAPATAVLELYNQSPSERKSLWLVTEAGHNDLDEVAGEAYYNRISIFMVKSFPQRTNKSKFKKLV